jgi:HK97 family phage major capsid protein
MNMLKELLEKLEKLRKDAVAICDLAEKEGRDFTEEERDQVAKMLAEGEGLKEQIKQLRADADMRQQILALGAGLEQSGHNGDRTPDGQHGMPMGGAHPLTLGEQFVESEAWKSWFRQVAPNGLISEGAKGLISPPVQIEDLGLFRQRRRGQKTLITGASPTSAGAFVVPDDTGIYEPIGRYPLTLRDLISVRTTTSDAVEFVRQTDQVTQAVPVPEANVTEYSGGSGEVSGEKPEGTVAFERVQELVKTIAVWIPATKRALSDVAQLRGLIDQELREDIAEELENQLLNGNGVGENFTGLNNTAGTLVQLFNTDIITTSRQAITNLLINGRQMPTAWLMNPNDWEAFDLAQDTGGRYYWGGPMVQGQKTLWGVPVVQSFFLAEGTAWLANWRKMVLWDREQTTISVSDSHADFFIRNLLAILAEMRAAMGVIRPSAFVEVELTSGS